MSRRSEKLLIPDPSLSSDLTIKVEEESCGFKYTIFTKYASLNNFMNGINSNVFFSQNFDFSSSDYGLSEFIKLLHSHSFNSDDAINLQWDTRLRTIGQKFFDDYFDSNFKQLYWDYISDGSIKSIRILSKSSKWIPWELIFPYDPDDPEHESKGFLCEVFDVTRWFPLDQSIQRINPPPITLNLNPFVILAAEPPQSAIDEGLQIQLLNENSELHDNYRKIAVYLGKDKLELDSLHIACHNYSNTINADFARLDFGNGVFLTPNDIQKCNMNRCSMVFLNACQSGRHGSTPIGTGGWPLTFISKGKAACFIGTMWDVYDELALNFAVNFYKKLTLEGFTVAQAIRDSREQIRRIGDPTWLSYVVYANPYAKVVNQ